MPDIRDVVDQLVARMGPGASPEEVEAAAARILSSSAGESNAVRVDAVLGISLMDCSSRLFSTVRTHVYDKIRRIGSHLDASFRNLAVESGLDPGEAMLATTPLAYAAPVASVSDFLALADDLEEAAIQCGCARIDGFSADAERHLTSAARRVLGALPDVLKSTRRVSAVLHCGSALSGLNLDAVRAASELWSSGVDTEAAARRFSLACNASHDIPASPDAALRMLVTVSPLLHSVAAAADGATADEMFEIAARTFMPLSASAGAVGKQCAEALSRRSGLEVVFDGIELAADTDPSWHRAALPSLLHVSSSARARPAGKHSLVGLPEGTSTEPITGAAANALLPALQSTHPAYLHLFIGRNIGGLIDLGPTIGRAAVSGAPSSFGLERGQIPPA